MNQNSWKFACLTMLAILLVGLVALQLTDHFFDIQLRRQATGSIADVKQSLETKYQDEAIVLFRAETQANAVQFTPAACLRLPKGVSEFAWKNLSLYELRDGPHCQGAIAFVRAGESPVHIAFIYDGIVGLPTDTGVSVTLPDFLAAIDAAEQ